jgi:hypothetical protein
MPNIGAPGNRRAAAAASFSAASIAQPGTQASYESVAHGWRKRRRGRQEMCFSGLRRGFEHEGSAGVPSREAKAGVIPPVKASRKCGGV